MKRFAISYGLLVLAFVSLGCEVLAIGAAETWGWYVFLLAAGLSALCVPAAVLLFVSLWRKRELTSVLQLAALALHLLAAAPFLLVLQ